VSVNWKEFFLESVRTDKWLRFLFKHRKLEGLLEIERKWPDNIFERDWNKFQPLNTWLKSRINYKSYADRRAEEINFCFEYTGQAIAI
jgi:hypothetical protein